MPSKTAEQQKEDAEEWTRYVVENVHRYNPEAAHWIGEHLGRLVEELDDDRGRAMRRGLSREAGIRDLRLFLATVAVVGMAVDTVFEDEPEVGSGGYL